MKTYNLNKISKIHYLKILLWMFIEFFIILCYCEYLLDLPQHHKGTLFWLWYSVKDQMWCLLQKGPSVAKIGYK